MTGPKRTRRSGRAPVGATNGENMRTTPETPSVRVSTAEERRACADIVTEDELYSQHVKEYRRAGVAAAYDASVNELTRAWKENPEFGNALNEATVVGRTESLKEYLASDKPLSVANRLGLIAFIEGLEQRIASLEPKEVGRPQRKSDIWNAATAERSVALLVESDQAAWRKKNGRERVPRAQTEEMINRRIAEAAKDFGVPVASIKKDNILIALKAGRI